MKQPYITFATILLFAIVFCKITYARKDKDEKIRPEAILVQVRAEQIRINALTKLNSYAMLKQVKKDRDKVREVTINDFSDHFDFCPVFYFSDTDYDKVKNKQFSGILYNADGTTVTHVPEYLNNGHYLVASYGKPYFQNRKDRVVTDSSDNQHMSDLPYSHALIISNERLMQVGYFYRMNSITKFYIRKCGEKYIYQSPKFDIEYCPAAKSLNDALHKNPYRIPIGLMYE